MSTRSAITVPVDGAFQGVYHHFDGYPEGLGRTLLLLHQQTFVGNTDAMVKTLITDHPAGWSTLLPSMREEALDVWPREAFDSAGFPKDYGAPATAPSCYCHGARSESGNTITCLGPNCSGADCDPLWIEWLYVITPDHLGIWDGHNINGDEYRHRHIADIPWNFDAGVVTHVQAVANTEIADSDPIKQQIDAMDPETMARTWRSAPAGDPMFQKESYADYFVHRFKMLGGMTPELSKRVGFAPAQLLD